MRVGARKVGRKEVVGLAPRSVGRSDWAVEGAGFGLHAEGIFVNTFVTATARTEFSDGGEFWQSCSRKSPSCRLV